MNTRLAAALASAVGLLAAGLALAGTASATTVTPAGPSFATCANLAGWYVNGDEADRKPEATAAGLKFEPADLIHHAVTGVTVETLTPGDYVAAPAPDQASFFSVEVRDVDGSGYATLRYNRSTHLWNLVTGGQFYEHANPAILVDMPPVDRSHQVISFGVGYTKNPPGTVTTVVSRVTFNGNSYPLTCAPPTTSPTASASASQSASVSPSASTSASASASASASVSASASQSASASPSATRTTPATTRPTTSPAATFTPLPAGNSGDDLPLTGSPVFLIAGLGVAVVGTGAVLTILARRRKVNYGS
jgi:hypothetical protein